MIQERNELILGLQLCPGFAQLSHCSNTRRDPVTASPTGDEAYLIDMPQQVWSELNQEEGSLDAAVDFLKNCLGQTVELGDLKNVRIMVCVPRLEAPMDQRIPRAVELLGIERKNIYLQDYSSSFYYYTINQKRELWNGDVALLEYQDGVMLGRVLHIDRGTRPALLTVEEAGRQVVNEQMRDGRSQEEWDQERDRLFFEFLKKVFERRNVVTSYLIGDYFDKTWAQRSFQYLCYHRHAFQGKNLFTKGACYAAMERAGVSNAPDFLFMGADIIHENIGMYLRVRGKEVYYPMITAGVNWYEAHHDCEFIPDEEKSISLLTKPMNGGQAISHILRLTDFPERPNRATRLRMTVYFVSAARCIVEVEDLGFGGFFKPSGKKWKREIHLNNDSGVRS